MMNRWERNVLNQLEWVLHKKNIWEIYIIIPFQVMIFLKLYSSLVLYAKLTGDVHTFVFWLYLRDRVGFPLFI